MLINLHQLKKSGGGALNRRSVFLIHFYGRWTMDDGRWTIDNGQ